jgi:gamma-glutamyl:cysteine ligase YbdK (ATP-grasp superfamily)
MTTTPLGLFDAFGIEMEYMLVDQETLDVRPQVDQVLAALAGHPTSEVEIGPISWSNELALHVIELKTTQPAKQLRRLPARFENAIRELRVTLDSLGLMLLPTAVHPWMNAGEETRLWPHQGREIYETYDRVFNCRTHGWANVQSVHLNLPFNGDDEFARLHAAVRIVLPLLPALAASSPVIDGRYSGLLDTRMLLYKDHCQEVPVLTGDLIPEPLFDQASYEREVFSSIASAIAPHDPDGLMQVEFLNARGAIARFDRGSIEIRVMDVQEYPGADVAICAAVAAVVRALCEGKWSSRQQQMEMPSENLRHVLDQTCARAEHTIISDTQLLGLFGVKESQLTGKQLWARLLGELRLEDSALDDLFAPLQVILTTGTLASRICTALGQEFSRESLVDIYREVGDSLTQWEPFQP